MPTYDRPDGSYTSVIPSGTRSFVRVTGPHFGFNKIQVIRDHDRCQQAKSEHCECRGIDFFQHSTVQGRSFFEWCISKATPLGIQSVIFNRRAWGFGDWFEYSYTGPNPHLDHVHVGLNRWAAANLTDTLIRKHLSTNEEDDWMADLTPDELTMFKQMIADYPKTVQRVKNIEDAVSRMDPEILNKLNAINPGSGTAPDRLARALKLAGTDLEKPQ